MAYAIVKFLEEDDAVGIVPTNWLSEDKTYCSYPLVGSDNLKNKLILKREEPDASWMKYPVSVFKEYSHYSAAKNRLTEAENTSDIESESADEVDKPRKKIARKIRLPGESSSENELSPGHMKQQARKKKFKQISTGHSQQQLKKQSVPQLPPPHTLSSPQPPPCSVNLIDETEQSQSLILSSLQKNPKQFAGQEVSNLSTSLPHRIEDKEKEDSFSWLRTSTMHEEHQNNHSLPQTHQENDEIEKLKSNQTTMWAQQGEIIEMVKLNCEKLDLILRKLESNAKEKPERDDVKLLSLLPVGIEEFKNLNEKINESHSFRRNIIQILMTSGGKDAKAMVANMLRKTLSDDVGLRYSLTGKQIKNGQPKLSFEKTAVYKVIAEACFRMHKGVKESIVREGVSDWLMQSKFRKIRKEKRKNREGEWQSINVEEEVADFDN